MTRTRKPVSSASKPRRIRARRRAPRRTRKTGGLVSALGQAFAHLALAGVVALTGLFVAAAIYARGLPSTADMWATPHPPSVRILARDGTELTIRGRSYGPPTRLSELPGYVPEAVMAIEDRNFYHHIGFNPLSVARALFVNVSEGEVRQGGSTITQQLAKNLFLSSDKTVKRKVRELMLAIWLERRFTKDEILTLYLNRVYFGAGAYGIEAASRRYFSKPASELSLGEAALLAGLLKAPSRYAPTSSPDEAGERARQVLAAMADAGFITEAEERRTAAQPVELAAADYDAAPYFVDYVRGRIADLVGDANADIVVKTTLDPSAQWSAERAIVENTLPDGLQAAVVVLDNDGALRAMVGGRDYARSQYNRAVSARRQPGSAFKPFVYLAAAAAGARPDDHYIDAPIAIDDWEPDNYAGEYFGEVTMREALARSLNSVAVQVQEQVGRPAVADVARRAGLEIDLPDIPSMALGVELETPLQLATAYAPFANGGAAVEPYAIERIETEEGDVLYQRRGPTLRPTFDPGDIAVVNQMLLAVTSWGTGKAAALPGVATFGKTGTTQDSRDAWFAGHAGGLVGVVWIGRDDDAPMSHVTGGGPPAHIWRAAMAGAFAASPPRLTQAAQMALHPQPPGEPEPAQASEDAAPQDAASPDAVHDDAIAGLLANLERGDS